jgi:hypothetical protein
MQLLRLFFLLVMEMAKSLVKDEFKNMATVRTIQLMCYKSDVERSTVKGTGKVYPRTGHKDPKGE